MVQRFKTHWLIWAAAEGAARAMNRLLNKFIGLASSSLAGVFAVSLMIGLVQSVAGLIYGLVYKQSVLVVSGKQVLGSIIFGLVAFIMTILGIVIFIDREADAGIVTFIASFSIVFGAVWDKIFFHKSIRSSQWLGIAVFVAAGYAMLNFPGLQSLLSLPGWIMLALLLAILASVNEALAKAVKKMNPLVNNFWIGLTTLILSLAGLFIFGGNLGLILSQLPRVFYLVAPIIGLGAVSLVSFRLLSLKRGAAIAQRSLVMRSSFLLLTMLLGVIFYHESLTVGKLIGVVGFFAALAMIEKEIVIWLKPGRL